MLEVWESLLCTATITLLVVSGWIAYWSGKIGISFTRSYYLAPITPFAFLLGVFAPMIVPENSFYHSALRFFDTHCSPLTGFFVAFFSITLCLSFTTIGWLVGYIVYRYRLRLND